MGRFAHSARANSGGSTGTTSSTSPTPTGRARTTSQPGCPEPAQPLTASSKWTGQGLGGGPPFVLSFIMTGVPCQPALIIPARRMGIVVGVDAPIAVPNEAGEGA